VTALPLVAPSKRTPEERSARAQALRNALGPPSGWPEDARAELAERTAIIAADGESADPDRAAEEMVRAALLRSAP
jgi:hypothetical protein